jgi:hypothetical protein
LREGKAVLGTLYGLTTEADGGVIRYVGFTTRKIRKRINGHLADALVSQRSVCRWVSERTNAGQKITAVILKRDAVLQDESEAIKKLLGEGLDLLNETLGGMGTNGRVITPAMRAVFKAPASDALKATLRNFNGRRDYRIVGAKMSAHWSDPGERAAHAERVKKAKAARTPEQRAATAEKTRLYWSDPENRRKHSEKVQAARAARLAKEPP